ncbi:reverse transcriptase, putative [Ixodes scapularis]|uniref:Reverse transcriptase, putative n=1 Tax=Ixodes scapularis TaxID=6945 RepID=B7PTE6_IXOSC|nr:reverse transcriptase, putative [Ixodes scapularis]|eukprot:XP_002404290.1 reverse transcriptase, putative [Ixodes scapularis]
MYNKYKKKNMFPTKGEQQYKLSRIIHKAVAEHGEAEVKRRLDAKYLPVSPKEKHPEYQGAENIEVDQDIEEWEVRNAMQDLNRRSASGPDRVSNKALRNLNDAAVTALTAYFNKCWRAGKLPRQWKQAKTILIPKPSKSPDIENLRPISLTSCVGQSSKIKVNKVLRRTRPLYLTPLIEACRLDEAKSLSRVGSLGDVEDVPSYAGFLTVQPDMGSNMFFWFFPAKVSGCPASIQSFLV